MFRWRIFPDQKGVIQIKLIQFIFFVLFVVFAVVSINLSIKEAERNYDWRNNPDGTVTVIHYNGETNAFSIPDELNGKKVAKISADIFTKRYMDRFSLITDVEGERSK